MKKPRSIRSLLDKIRAADHRNYGDVDDLEEALDAAQTAGEALGRLGEAAAPAVPELLAMMRDNRDPYLHQAAAFGLREIGAHAVDSAVEIVGLLLDEEDGKSSAFLDESLGRISALGRTDDPVVPALLEAFGDEEKRVRVSGALASIAKRDKAIFDMLSGLLDDKDPRARTRAAGVFSLMGKSGRKAGPRLRKALRDDDPRVRETAFLALSHMDLLDAKAYVKEVARCMIREEDQRAAANQRNELEGRRDELKNLAAELLRAGENPDPDLSFKAALASARADPRSEAAARVLWESLAKGNAENLLPALEVLGEMARFGGFPLDAVPPTAKLLASGDPVLRRAAVQALDKMTSGDRLPPRDRPFLDKPGARKALVSREAMRGIRLCLKDADWEVVNSAVYLLGHLGEDAAAALPELLSVLDKPHESTPHWAVSELQQRVMRVIPGMGTRARKAVPHIVPFLSDESWVLRLYAAETLCGLRSTAKAAVPALVMALDRDDGFNYMRVRDDYAKALAAVAEAEGLERVRRLLADEQEKTDVKEGAVDGLGESGTDAAVDLLIEALGFSSKEMGYRIFWRLGDTRNARALEALYSLADRSASRDSSLEKAIRTLEDSEVRGLGTPESPWLVGNSGHAYRDEASDPPALVVVDYKTEVRYHLQCLKDLHEMLKSHGDWMAVGTADEQEPAAEGTVEAWARSSDNPVAGWYGLTEGERGRFARYIPPVMVALKLAEFEEKRRPTDHLMRALSGVENPLAIAGRVGAKRRAVHVRENPRSTELQDQAHTRPRRVVAAGRRRSAPAADAIGPINLDDAWALAIEHARDHTDFYGPEYAAADLLLWEVLAAEEREGHYEIRLCVANASHSRRVMDRFRGQEVAEQFIFEKTGELRERRILDGPSEPTPPSWGWQTTPSSDPAPWPQFALQASVKLTATPYTIAVDGEGNIYVPHGRRLDKFSADGRLLLRWDIDVAGVALALDRDGMVYVTSAHGVKKFNPDGLLLFEWCPRDGETFQIDSPNGVGVDEAGNLYTLESYTRQIQKYTSDGTFLLKWGRRMGTSGEDGLDLPEWPVGILVDGDGHMASRETGASPVASTDIVNVFYRFGGPGRFNSPRGIAVDNSGNVYVVDAGNHAIQKFSADGHFLRMWGRQGGYDGPEEQGNGLFRNPMGVAVDRAGNVYVADTGNRRVQVFDSQGRFLTKWDCEGGEDGPRWITVDRNGKVYVSDREAQAVLVFAPL